MGFWRKLCLLMFFAILTLHMIHFWNYHDEGNILGAYLGIMITIKGPKMALKPPPKDIEWGDHRQWNKFYFVINIKTQNFLLWHSWASWSPWCLEILQVHCPGHKDFKKCHIWGKGENKNILKTQFPPNLIYRTFLTFLAILMVSQNI